MIFHGHPYRRALLWITLNVAFALSVECACAQQPTPFTKTGGPNGMQALASVANYDSEHFRWKSGAPIPLFFADAPLFSKNAWQADYKQVAESQVTKHSDSLSILKMFPQSQPGDIIRVSGNGLSDVIMVYLGEKSFVDVPDDKLLHSFFVYAWYSGLEVNTFPPRNHERLFRYAESKRGAKPRALLYTRPQQMVDTPGQRGIWTWIRPGTGADKKSLFTHPTIWKHNPHVTLYRNKNAPRKYFIRRPIDMLAAGQVNQQVCFFANLTSLDLYHGAPRNSAISHQIEILNKYYIDGTVFTNSMLDDLLTIVRNRNPNPQPSRPEWASATMYRKDLMSTDKNKGRGWVYGNKGVPENRYEPFPIWSTMKSVETEVLTRHFKLKPAVTPEQDKQMRDFFIAKIENDRPVITLITAPDDYKEFPDDALLPSAQFQVKTCAALDDYKLLAGEWHSIPGHWVIVLGMVISPSGNECLYYIQDPATTDVESNALSDEHIYKLREEAFFKMVNERRAPAGKYWPNVWYHD